QWKASKLLGRHVGELALHDAGCRLLGAAHHLRDSEIREACHTVDTDEDVVGGHVAMHDAERAALLVDRLVRGMETFEDVTQHSRSDRSRQSAFRSRVLSQ